MRWIYSRRILIASAIAVLAAGCGKPKARIYNVPKQEGDTASISDAESLGEVRWEKPDAWQTLPPTALRKGNFQFEDEEGNIVSIYLSAHPGGIDNLNNEVNEWLRSLGKAPLEAAEFLERTVSSRINGRSAVEISLDSEIGDGSRAESFRGVSLLSPSGSWGISMKGPIETVEQQSESFEVFLKSISFAIPPKNAPASNKQGGQSKLTYTTPEGWEEVEHSKYRIASFLIRKEGLSDADVSVSWFPGAAGGVHANVNRWRKQLGLSEWTPREIDRAGRSRKFGNREFRIFDIRSYPGDNATAERILAAISNDEHGTWFVRLKGEPFVVETQRRRFFSFLEESTFGPGAPEQ